MILPTCAPTCAPHLYQFCSPECEEEWQSRKDREEVVEDRRREWES